MTDLLQYSILPTLPDPSSLELEPGHPGLGDAAYVQRHEEIVALLKRYGARLNRPGDHR